MEGLKMKRCIRCNGYGILLNPTLADKKEFPLTLVYEKCKDCNGRGYHYGPSEKTRKIKDFLKICPPVRLPVPLPITIYQKKVLMYYNLALKNGRCPVNFYYEPHVLAQRQLVNRGDIKEVVYRGLFLGYEYQGHLFNTVAGSGDCEEILVMKGKLEGKEHKVEGKF